MLYLSFLCFFFFNDTATTEIYTLSLHDALPISFGALPLVLTVIFTRFFRCCWGSPGSYSCWPAPTLPVFCWCVRSDAAARLPSGWEWALHANRSSASF